MACSWSAPSVEDPECLLPISGTGSVSDKKFERELCCNKHHHDMMTSFLIFYSKRWQMFRCVAGVSTFAWRHSATDVVFCKIKPHFWPFLSFETDSLTLMAPYTHLLSSLFCKAGESKALIRDSLSIKANDVDESSEIEPVLDWNCLLIHIPLQQQWITIVSTTCRKKLLTALSHKLKSHKLMEFLSLEINTFIVFRTLVSVFDFLKS